VAPEVSLRTRVELLPYADRGIGFMGLLATLRRISPWRLRARSAGGRSWSAQVFPGQPSAPKPLEAAQPQSPRDAAMAREALIGEPKQRKHTHQPEAENHGQNRSAYEEFHALQGYSGGTARSWGQLSCHPLGRFPARKSPWRVLRSRGLARGAVVPRRWQGSGRRVPPWPAAFRPSASACRRDSWSGLKGGRKDLSRPEGMLRPRGGWRRWKRCFLVTPPLSHIVGRKKRTAGLPGQAGYRVVRASWHPSCDWRGNR
jgi:hypothetical protein